MMMYSSIIKLCNRYVLTMNEGNELYQKTAGIYLYTNYIIYEQILKISS